jgi:hypothetical protein
VKLATPGEAEIRSAFTASARSVFRKLFAEGPATRPQLCATLALSRRNPQSDTKLKPAA